jgi:hypothetical protein
MRRTYKTIKCATCHRDATAPNSRTQFCTTCRLARQVAWQDGRPSSCSVCGADFIAWYGRDWRFCSTHASPGRDSVKGECASCWEKDRDLYNEDVRLCYPCLLDPQNYDRVRSYVLRVHERIMSDQN